MDALKRLLDSGLRKLTFGDNFFSTVQAVSIGPSEEIRVPHDLNIIPSYYILGSQDQAGQIVIGDEPWTNSYITIKNTSSNTINTTLIILG